MVSSNNINKALDSWRNVKTEQSHKEQSVHLAEKALVRMAADGGLQEALVNDLEHLDNCPLCLANWSAWRRAFSVTAECEDEKDGAEDMSSDMAYGFLEAAATTSSKTQGMTIESSCGSYRLEVLPDREQPEEGMVILSCLTKSDDKKLTVRDRQGREILSGTLKNGRLARLYHNLSKLDLSIWTVGQK